MKASYFGSLRLCFLDTHKHTHRHTNLQTHTHMLFLTPTMFAVKPQSFLYAHKQSRTSLDQVLTLREKGKRLHVGTHTHTQIRGNLPFVTCSGGNRVITDG